MTENAKLHCGTHGEACAAYVCCHLVQVSDRRVGFNVPDEDDFQAWCNECDLMLEAHGEWNDVTEGFADIRLVCEFCFARIRLQHGLRQSP